MFKVVTPVASELVSLAEARLQCKLATDETSEDTLITSLITVARQYAEHYTDRALAPQTLEMALDKFPWCSGEILLDMPPVTSVTSIKYDDVNGAEQTLATSVYAFGTYGESRRISLKYGQVWPVTYGQANAVRIQYVTGYTTVPTAAKQAMLLVIGHLFDNRQDVLVADGRVQAIQLPMGAQALLDTIKVYG